MKVPNIAGWSASGDLGHVSCNPAITANAVNLSGGIMWVPPVIIIYLEVIILYLICHARLWNIISYCPSSKILPEVERESESVTPHTQIIFLMGFMSLVQ